MTTEQRLDTVEDDLDVVKKLLVSAARYAESANQGLDRLTERFDGLTERFDGLTVKVDELTTAQTNTQARIDSLTAAQDRTQAQLGQLVESQSQALSRLDRIERALDTLASNQVAERDARLALREDLEILYQAVQLSEESTERSLSQLTLTVNRLAESQQANDAAVNNLSGRNDLLAAHLSQLTLTVNRLAESQQALAESQQANEVAINNLARLVVRSVETAEADRAEIRRIWDYLLHQSGNGSGG